MRKKLFSSLIGIVLCAVMVFAMIPFAQGAEYTLTLHNPKGEIAAPKMIPLAERSGTFASNEEYPLAGMRILIIGYSKDAALWHQSVQDAINAKYTGENAVTFITNFTTAWSDVLGEKGVANYNNWARGGTAAALTTEGIDAVIAGLAN